MEWNQIMEVTEPKNGKNVITLVSEFDFKGYSSLEDSQKMAMKLLNLIPEFLKFYEVCCINSKPTCLFNFDKQKTKRAQISNDTVFNNTDDLNESFKTVNGSILEIR